MHRFPVGILTFFFLLLFSSSHAQRDELEIGYWRDHLPYSNANSVTEGNGVIYCGSAAGFTAYTLSGQQLTRYNTITGLSDVGVAQLKYNKASNVLVVAYNNGNLDLMKYGRILNLPSIKDADIIADKTINNIFFDKSQAYLACGFGIVVLDLNRMEVSNTYLIGANSEPLKVNDVYVHHPNNTIYAASDAGVYTADLRSNLNDYNNWSKLTILPDSAYNLVSFFSGKLLFAQHRTERDSDLILGLQDGTLDTMTVLQRGFNEQLIPMDDRLVVTKEYNIRVFDAAFNQIDLVYQYGDEANVSCNQALFAKDRYYIADRELGLVEYFGYNGYTVITPNGPNVLNINNIDIKNKVVWGTFGILDAGYRFSYSPPFFNVYENLSWNGIDLRDALDDRYGFIKVESDPLDAGHAFAASWDNGVIEIRDGKLEQIYDSSTITSTGHTLTPLIGTNIIRSGGLAFDEQHNLWITCSETPYALNVYTANGNWKRFFLGAYVDDGTIVGDLIIDRNGYKWILLSRGDTYRIIIYDDNRTPEDESDDRVTTLGSSEGAGNIPGSISHCIAEDENGAIWIGTDEGPVVFYSPGNVFSSKIDAQQIFVEQDGLTQILLETEVVRTIAVDGANRKWFGTENSGAYLMSSDGTKQINHFTAENSPLFSNDIKDIEIDNSNGEIFFCTAEGLISYKGTATTGGSDFENVQVFPNPVPKGYGGVIAIKGMANNANVKITDVNGLLIYETTANGGQAIWNGVSRQGRKAQNGVYLVFSTDDSGEYQNVTKFLYLNN